MARLSISANLPRRPLLFVLEITLGLLIPLPMLLFRKIREDRDGLFAVAVLVITGFLLNRLNVSITGMEASSGVHYFPRWTEVAVTLSIVGVGFLLFSLAVRYLNVMEKQVPGVGCQVSEKTPNWSHNLGTGNRKGARD